MKSVAGLGGEREAGTPPGKVTLPGRSFALHRNKGRVPEQLGEPWRGRTEWVLGGAARPGGWKAEKTAVPGVTRRFGET